MPVHNEGMPLGSLREALSNIDADESLPVMVKDYYNESKIGIFSIRKVVETNEDGEIENAYIVLNG
jgi:hypothetical protein